MIAKHSLRHDYVLYLLFQQLMVSTEFSGVLSYWKLFVFDELD